MLWTIWWWIFELVTRIAVNTKPYLKKQCLARSPIWQPCALRVHSVVYYQGFSSDSAFFWVFIGKPSVTRAVSKRMSAEAPGCTKTAVRMDVHVLPKGQLGGKTPFPSRQLCFFRFRIILLYNPQNWLSIYYKGNIGYVDKQIDPNQFKIRHLLETKLDVETSAFHGAFMSTSCRGIKPFALYIFCAVFINR